MKQCRQIFCNQTRMCKCSMYLQVNIFYKAQQHLKYCLESSQKVQIMVSRQCTLIYVKHIWLLKIPNRTLSLNFFENYFVEPIQGFQSYTSNSSLHYACQYLQNKYISQKKILLINLQLYLKQNNKIPVIDCSKSKCCILKV